MSSLVSLGILTASYTVAWLATMAAISWLRRRGVVDVSNQRSLHVVPTPRGGGLGILAGIVAGVTLAAGQGLKVPGPALLAGATLVALIGLADDQRPGGVRVLVRLTVHFVAAGIVVGATGSLPRLPLPPPLDVPLGVAAFPLTMLWIVAVANLYNFLDGMDGFAALQGGIAGAALALLDPGGPMGPIGLAIAGACFGFLPYNWHPARVFMGDVGAPTLGFLLAALPLELDAAARSQGVFAVGIILWFFLSDGTFTICRRALRHEPIWKPHRAHLYQRLVLSGLRHDQVALSVLGPGAILAGIAVAAAHHDGYAGAWIVFGLAIVCFLAYCEWTFHRERIAGKGSTPPLSPEKRTPFDA